MSSERRLFKNACEVLDVTECTKSTPGVRYIDPCNCYDQYYCLNYEVKSETCPKGTAYDGTTCDHENEVLLNYCDLNHPWLRCNVSDVRHNELEHICTGSTVTQSSSTTEGVTVPPRGPEEDNLGLIIGLAIAAVIIVIFSIILVILFLKRKKAKDKIQKDRPGTVQNPEYFEDGNRDDPYAIIDDSRHTPSHNNSYMIPNPDRKTENGTLQGSTIADTLPPNIDTVYDNSALRAEPPSGYESACDTLKPGATEPQYFTLTKEEHIETENDNNTPKESGISGSFLTGERNSIDWNAVVNDDAIKVDQSGNTWDASFRDTGSANLPVSTETDIVDDSPYKS